MGWSTHLRLSCLQKSVTSANNVPVTVDVGGEQVTKEAPRLEPKVFERSSELIEQRAEFGDISVPTVR